MKSRSLNSKPLKILVIKDKDIYPLMPEFIKSTLSSLNYKVEIVDFQNSVSFVEEVLEKKDYDCIFNALPHYTRFFSGFKSFLKFFKISCTHSEVLALEIGSNKILSIRQVENIGILCPLSQDMSVKEYATNNKYGNHMVTTLEHSIHRPFLVDSATSKKNAVDFYSKNNCSKVVMQEYIEGHDIYSLVLSDENEDKSLVGAIGALSVFPCVKNRIIKSKDYVDYYTKKIEDQKLSEIILQKSELIFNSIGFKGVCLMHFKCDKNNNIYFLNANPNPEITDKSIVNQICKIQNIDIKTIINIIVLNAVKSNLH